MSRAEKLPRDAEARLGRDEPPYTGFSVWWLLYAWLAMLFVLLGSTADDYFSPALEQLSEDAGLPPRFAGVTLLALGNGAPDVSSNVHLVASDAVGERAGLDTALGALTGAGMFVTTCVAGMVMVIADGAKAKGALLRDVTAYGAASAVVWGVLAGGRVTRAGAATLLALYVLFVLVVLAADLYHRRPGGPYDLARRSGATEPDDAVEMMLDGYTGGHTLLRDFDADDPEHATCWLDCPMARAKAQSVPSLKRAFAPPVPIAFLRANKVAET